MRNNNEIGALWLKKSKDGKTFFSGVVEIEGVEQKIVIFKNSYKQTDKQPDYRILKSKPMPDTPKQETVFDGDTLLVDTPDQEEKGF